MASLVSLILHAADFIVCFFSFVKTEKLSACFKSVTFQWYIQNQETGFVVCSLPLLDYYRTKSEGQ